MSYEIRPKTWLWSTWLLTLAACPAGLLFVMATYPNVASHPPPWSGPVDLIQSLLAIHGWVSLGAAVALLAWERRGFVVLAIWIGIGCWWLGTQFLGFLDMSGKTGAYF